MAIKANVSFTQKLGQPDYGSVGAGCTLEIEMDSNLLERDPDEFRVQLELAYLTCRQAVEQQLTAFEGPQRPPARMFLSPAQSLELIGMAQYFRNSSTFGAAG